MALGPGKYDDLATHAREASAADAVIVIVVNGDKGSGFSVQTNGTVAPRLPELLRILADAIERDTA
jgi:hypothetical protein